MIIANGTIEVKRKTTTGTGLDPETGFPIAPSRVSWDSPIECQYSANRYDKLGRAQGEHFTVASFTILIEEQQPLFEAEQVRLKDRNGKLLGEFSVLAIEPLEAVCQTRIMV